MMFIHLLFLIHYCLSAKSFTIPYEDFIYCYTTKVYLDLKHPFIIDIDLSLHFTWLSDIKIIKSHFIRKIIQQCISYNDLQFNY